MCFVAVRLLSKVLRLHHSDGNQAHHENVDRSVDVPIMVRTTFGTYPMSIFKREIFIFISALRTKVSKKSTYIPSLMKRELGVRNNVSFGIDRRMFLPISDLLNLSNRGNQWKNTRELVKVGLYQAHVMYNNQLRFFIKFSVA